jgi:hypothetical protein
MTADIRQSVASGKPYAVTRLPVGGSPSLDLFVGDAEFTIDGGRAPLVIRGHGVRHGDLVRFHEKDHFGGKDVRVWNISQRDGGFVTESLSAF